MTEKPQYIVVAGINGAGKSTLYKAEPKLFSNTERLNADEISVKNGLDWRNPKDNFQAMRLQVEKLHDLLDNRQSLHIETTLSGAGKTHLNLIEKAKAKGYETTLLYVGLDNAERAIKRVSDRVRKGGHGIDPDVIKWRYDQSMKNLNRVMKSVDKVIVYDNSGYSIKQIYYKNKKTEMLNKTKGVSWIDIDKN